MRSSIFINNISVVDHGYINYRGQIIGGSFNPSFIVTGSVDKTEKVVVDFSTIKKDIKNLIDIHLNDVYDNGFDHKIWFIEGYSQGTYKVLDNGYCIISTDATELSVPVDAVKIIQKVEGYDPEYSIDYIGKSFESYLTKKLELKYPDISVQVDCYNNIETHRINKDDTFFMFTYSHGLKDSTSYGCQNIAHGHLSFLQPGFWFSGDLDKMATIATELDGAVFVNKENIVYGDNDVLDLEYTTNRGTFKVRYLRSANKLLVLDTETTIEYLAEYIRTRYSIHDFFVSEGLSKGTYLA